MLLSELKCGEEKKVVKILGDQRIVDRLKSMGLTEGVRIKVIRRAPLNDPIEISLRGFYMAIRIEQAKKIKVE